MPQLVEPSAWNVVQEATDNGCFETMRAYHGRIFRLEAHLSRLHASCQDLGLTLPDRRELARLATDTLASSRLQEAIVRIALMPRPDGRTAPSIVVRSVSLPPASAYRRGIRLAIVPTRKFSVNTIDPQAKYSARLGSVLAVLDAQLRRADEALWVDAMGYVTESTASNVGIVREGTIVTPPCHLGLLAGITRDVLFELAAALGIRETPLTRHEVYNASEAFLLSTIKEILPVTSVDGRRIGSGTPPHQTAWWGGTPGPIARQLHRAFRQLVHRELHLV